MLRIRQSVRVIAVVVVMALLAAVGEQAAWADNANAWAVGNPRLHTGPGVGFPVVVSLKYNTPVVLEGRNLDGSWLLVHEASGTGRGWGAKILFKLAPDVKLSALPANLTTGDLLAPPVALLTPRILGVMRAIYHRGQVLGNNSRVFSLVGDCHTDHPAFLRQFGTGKYDLGPYGNLQEVIAYYSIAPRPGQANSFLTQSQAAHSAFTSEAVLAKEAILDPAVCKPNESPLQCEYRLDKPSVAIIDFGVVDVLLMTPQQFNFYMRYIIQETLNAGIIPVLTTAGENTSNPTKARLFNQIVVSLAAQKNVPLINLEGALSKLPDKGMDADGIHLTRPGDASQTGFFTPQNLQYGYTVRNLLTLQTLDEIMHQVIGQ